MVSSQGNAYSNAHSETLRSRHAGLETKLARELSRPAPDEAMMREIKKQKLKIKQQLSTG
ncbi:hypothetical protein HME9302_00386 [Alteripontixanthobacter maritimus]|uniref:DUF465 domain-containing protein n=1 Tax=Alteripontixanthobacter maritimus TaxID=2161824 RepID=A0A369Q2S9_9SPHN|nr:DUF465 domain-containing protein [Alteripontixanthobacter maritimus]RDC59201.1 hypothetical protein HME9302_00386 [Alteripontixanthobacter maritimus]